MSRSLQVRKCSDNTLAMKISLKTLVFVVVFSSNQNLRRCIFKSNYEKGKTKLA